MTFSVFGLTCLAILLIGVGIYIGIEIGERL